MCYIDSQATVENVESRFNKLSGPLYTDQPNQFNHWYIAEMSAPSWHAPSALSTFFWWGWWITAARDRDIPYCRLRMCVKGKFCWFKQLWQRAATDVKVTAHQLHVFVSWLFHWNNNFSKGQAPHNYARIVLQWIEGHHNEFYVMTRPFSPSDISPIEHIWNVTGRQLGAHEPPSIDLQKFRDLCLQIWYNIIQGTHQVFVDFFSRWIANVLRGKYVWAQY